MAPSVAHTEISVGANRKNQSLQWRQRRISSPWVSFMKEAMAKRHGQCPWGYRQWCGKVVFFFSAVAAVGGGRRRRAPSSLPFFLKCFSKRIIWGPWDLSLLIDTLNFSKQKASWKRGRQGFFFPNEKKKKSNNICIKELPHLYSVSLDYDRHLFRF